MSERQEEKQDENEFGFGVPDAKIELDINEFEEEIDTKTTRKYDPKLKFDEGVSKNFEKYFKE